MIILRSGMIMRSPTIFKSSATCLQHSRSMGYLLENKEYQPISQKKKLHVHSKFTYCKARTLTLSATVLIEEQSFEPSNLNGYEQFNTNTPSEDFAQLTSNTPIQESFSDYGLGGIDFYPHHWVQNFLEFIHTGLDVSWMPAIAIVTICMRLIGVPAYANMRKFLIRSMNNQPEQVKLQLKITTASTKQEKMKAQAELMDFFKEKDINPLKALSFQLPTMVTFMSFFNALQQMTEAKLPSLVTSGMMWFPNLTVADPYYLLPILSCTSLFLLIKFGGATSEIGPTASNPVVMKFIQFVPFLILPFVVAKPAAFFVFWLTSNTFSFIQMRVFAQEATKKYFNFPQEVKHSDAVMKQLMRMSNPIEIMKHMKKEQKAATDARKKVMQHMQKIDFSKDSTKK